MPTAEAAMCKCGETMMDNGRGGFFCDNCDVPQPQESVGMERRKTKQDVRFDLRWTNIINKEYTKKLKPESKEDSAENTEGEEQNG